MTQPTQDSGREAPAGENCVVCTKPLASGQTRWSVHFRGSSYAVCCPSCVRVFNSSPREFVERS